MGNKKHPEFHTVLQELLNEKSVSARQLAQRSGLSEATISRYLSGERTPKRDSAALRNLMEALSSFSGSSKGGLREEDLLNALPDFCADPAGFASRLHLLIERLHIPRAKLAASVGYDPSFISRVLNEERFPADYPAFARDIGDFIATYCDNAIPPLTATLKAVLKESYAEQKSLAECIASYLLETGAGEEDAGVSDNDASSVMGFLQQLDAFDLNNYMQRIRFDKLRVPSSPIVPKGSRHYAGIAGMKAAELEFNRRVILNNTRPPVYMYSSLPMESLAEDKDFSKKWMGSLALLLKKGHHLYMIHELNRPMTEMMLGLEAWIPLYMTGLVHPFYLDAAPSDDYGHLLRYSGNNALIGTCVKEDLDGAFFYLTSDKKNRSAMKHYKQTVFAHAKPLMSIYPESRHADFKAVLEKESEKNTPRITADKDSVLFKNIRITSFNNRCVIVSKTDAPPIHFVIRHPRLIDAIVRL